MPSSFVSNIENVAINSIVKSINKKSSAPAKTAPVVTLKLADVTFSYFEVPEEINFGGKQSLTIHKMIGGQRFIESMGVDEAPIEWHGRFRGQTAVGRANRLDTLRQQGIPIVLTWQSFKRLVVIEEFTARFMQFYEIPYSIKVQVLKNQDAPVLKAPQNQSSALNSQLSKAQGLSALLGNPAISGAISNITSLATSAGGLALVPKVLASQAIGVAQSLVKQTIASNASSITAGLTSTGTPTQVATANIGTSQNYQTMYTATNLQNTLGNMSTTVNSSGVSI